VNTRFSTVVSGILGFGLDNQGVGVHFLAGEEILLFYKTRTRDSSFGP
jgi:hypothetical protein